MKLKHLDLCSGIGGFSLGLESTGGFKTIGFAEIEPWCCAVLKKHWPKVKNYGDIGTIREVRADVVTASHPCQPFSCAGFGFGEADDRFIRPAMLDALAQSGASWFIYENVPGITAMELDDLLDDLENIGYEGQPFNIPTCGVGAYQLRMRIFIVAYNARKSEQESKMVFPARSVFKSGKPAIGLSGCLWQPDKQTYLSEMVGDVHGLPDWPHRAKGLGNAILPQIAQILGEIILSTYD